MREATLYIHPKAGKLSKSHIRSDQGTNQTQLNHTIQLTTLVNIPILMGNKKAGDPRAC